MLSDQFRATDNLDWLLSPEANLEDPLLGKQTGTLSVSIIFLKSFRKNLVLFLFYFIQDFLQSLKFTLIKSTYSRSLSNAQFGSVLYLTMMLGSSSYQSFCDGSIGWHLLVLKSYSSSIITSRSVLSLSYYLQLFSPFSFSSTSSSSTIDIQLFDSILTDFDSLSSV